MNLKPPKLVRIECAEWMAVKSLITRAPHDERMNVAHGEQNDHLSVVFNEMLPAIHKAGLSYWVYGGVGVAGVVGKFVRKNADVDIYVLEREFESVRSVRARCCHTNQGWILRDAKPLRGRPKVEILVGGSELLSVVPVYESDGVLEFRANTVVPLPLPDAVSQETRQVAGYSFVAPPGSVVKGILISLLRERPELLRRGSRRRIDALAVLSREELESCSVDATRRR